MGAETVRNDWFVATFPGAVEVTVDDSDPLFGVTTYLADIEQVGLFSIHVTNMGVDPFLAVGASQWIVVRRESLMARFQGMSPTIVHDRCHDPGPGLKVCDLVIQLESEGSWACVARLMAIIDGDFGRLLAATAIVPCSGQQYLSAASTFLDSVSPTVSQVKWKPEG